MKHWKYLIYLARHKWFVFLAGLGTGAPIWRLVIHDWSKFMPCEWFPYAEFFYGSTSKQRGDISSKPALEKFHLAWLHHQHLNSHHWQHWVLKEDSGAIICLEIQAHFVREMVADWCGAGRAITGNWDIQPWYKKNKDKIQLHEKSRALVEDLIFGARK